VNESIMHVAPTGIPVTVSAILEVSTSEAALQYGPNFYPIFDNNRLTIEEEDDENSYSQQTLGSLKNN
jgi:hypothetical protein